MAAVYLNNSKGMLVTELLPVAQSQNHYGMSNWAYMAAYYYGFEILVESIGVYAFTLDSLSL